MKIDESRTGNFDPIHGSIIAFHVFYDDFGYLSGGHFLYFCRYHGNICGQVPVSLEFWLFQFHRRDIRRRKFTVAVSPAHCLNNHLLNGLFHNSMFRLKKYC